MFATAKINGAILGVDPGKCKRLEAKPSPNDGNQ